MSASASVARRAVVVNPFAGGGRAVSRSALRASSIYLGQNARNIQLQNPALALLIPIRTITTEPNRSGPPSGPPPGFNAEEAKKPLPKDISAASKPTSKAKEAEEKDADKKAAAEDDKTGSLTELAERKEAFAASKGGKKDKTLTLGQKIKKEVQHYWDGTKLLATEVKISTRLAVRMAAGYELTRREHRQLQRTVQDLGRLVPFSAFVIIPFAELLLPVALKLFPNLLPSTYEDQKSKDKKASILRAGRKEVSDFLRQSIKETGLPLSVATAQKEEFANFFRKVRATGEKPTEQDVIKVCKAFKDDLTLDNLSRPQLVSMCRYMNLNTFGTDMMLRYQIRHRMRQIKRDDRAISYEGVESLTVAELQVACASRGIKSHGVSPARLREDLQTWLDLRLKEGVPSTLLVLSNAYMYGQTGDNAVANQIDALIGVMSSIPEELYHEIELEVHTAEGAATNRLRLEVLREQEELIEDESEQNESNQESGLATPRDVDDIDEKEERQERHMQAKDGGLEKQQVNEAIDAEADRAQAEHVAVKNKDTKRAD
ncbi:LETM1 domain-containing protein mdm28, mitochondrial [Cytospora mali]|uniref:LETM1 domain-containing protein mdm28, mitochondrial n=1 Tax=Cytospora mali TaxID=578113 RepID=A0A194V2K2_CYTMA|nr:LETM1 domain-containing protein mdm28, mitochondrial [Valsa mali var. pyri (nom. inval.)]